MIPLTALWLPILLSAIVVFSVSAMVWMVLPHHKSDFAAAEDEDALMDAVRNSVAGPGMYSFPWPRDSERNSEAYRDRLAAGPVGVLRVRDPQSVLDMKPAMAKSFLLQLVVGVFVAFLAARTLQQGASFHAVFHVVGTAAFLSHGFIGFQESIWFGLPGRVAFKYALDGLLYALLTAGIFGWLWPV